MEQNFHKMEGNIDAFLKRRFDRGARRRKFLISSLNNLWRLWHKCNLEPKKRPRVAH